MKEQKKKILYYINTQPFAVISSVNAAGNPESAMVGISENSKLELFFGTSKKSRKYANLIANKKVSIVFGGRDRVTVQYEGVAKELSGVEKKAAQKIHIEKHPSARKHMKDSNEVCFKIIPKWARYSDYNEIPHDIFEIKF